METVANHFNGKALAEILTLPNYSHCVICGKLVQQIQNETVNDYLDKTVVLRETLAEREGNSGRHVGKDVPPHARGSVAGCRLRWKLVWQCVQSIQHPPRINAKKLLKKLADCIYIELVI